MPASYSRDVAAIGIDDIAQALRRWQDFRAVNPTSLPPDVELRQDVAHITHSGDPHALNAQAGAVGLSEDGLLTFRVGVKPVLREIERGKGISDLEKAAYIGLIVGLLSRQFADEGQDEKDPPSR